MSSLTDIDKRYLEKLFGKPVIIHFCSFLPILALSGAIVDSAGGIWYRRGFA